MMDIRMPRLDGISRRPARIVEARPGSSREIVLLTTFDLDEYVFGGLLVVASGYLLIHAPPEDLLLAVAPRRPRRRARVPGPDAAAHRAFRPRPAAVSPLLTWDGLTDVSAVLLLVVRGLSNAAIASTAEDRPRPDGQDACHPDPGQARCRDRAHAVVYGYETRVVRPGDVGG